MSKYVAHAGSVGSGYQCVMWHYKTDINKDVLNRWFGNIYEHGVLRYVPTPVSGGTTVTIPRGTSLIVKSATSTADDVLIAKVDTILDYDIDISALANATYHVICIWNNPDDELVGVEFSLESVLPVSGNYVKLGEVVKTGGVIFSNTTTNQTIPGATPAMNGYSGFSGIGESGLSGTSGFSGIAGAATFIGDSGISGWSGFSGVNPGPQGISGFSGQVGVQGSSGASGFSGIAPSNPECIIMAISDEVSPLTTGTAKLSFIMPYAFTLSSVKVSLNVASTSGTPTFNIKKAGSTIFTTKPTIDINELTTVTAATPSVLLTTSFSANDLITVDIDVAGTGSTGAKIYMIGYKA
jgi:hypothetical protein